MSRKPGLSFVRTFGQVTSARSARRTFGVSRLQDLCASARGAARLASVGQRRRPEQDEHATVLVGGRGGEDERLAGPEGGRRDLGALLARSRRLCPTEGREVEG